MVFATVLLNGTAMALFAGLGTLPHPSFHVAAVLLGISGFCNVASGTGSQTLVQTAVDESMRGRVLSLWLVVNRGGPALGAMLFGWASQQFGFGWPTVLGGAGTMVVAAWVLRRRKALAAVLEKPPVEAEEFRPTAAAV
jgi:MFS family permease